MQGLGRYGKNWLQFQIVKACLRIQIGGMPESSSTEHLVLVKTWMTKIEERGAKSVFQTFDLKKFFNKESLVNTMCTLKEKAGISDKEYRLWYKLNENAKIGVRTAVGRGYGHKKSSE